MKVYVDKRLAGDIGTGIAPIMVEDDMSDAGKSPFIRGMFNLQGQEVNSDSSKGKLPRGIYIKNGKKVAY